MSSRLTCITEGEKLSGMEGLGETRDREAIQGPILNSDLQLPILCLFVFQTGFLCVTALAILELTL